MLRSQVRFLLAPLESGNSRTSTRRRWHAKFAVLQAIGRRLGKLEVLLPLTILAAYSRPHKTRTGWSCPCC